MTSYTDIDIDLADRQSLLKLVEYRKAILEDGSPHLSGIYATEIPHTPISMCATINYKEAEERGYFKIDLLNNSIYNEIKSEDHLECLMNKDPEWGLLEHSEFVDMVFQIRGHTEVLKKLKPKNIEQLAAALAIIRPGKKHLLDNSWDEIMKEVWTPTTDGSYFYKKAHAISYAVAVVVHMNLVCERLLQVP
jgi:hypothetical protein